jgi:hypothetical protein
MLCSFLRKLKSIAMPQSDAERLTNKYVNDVARGPFAIAPERADELLSQIFHGCPWPVDFGNGPANFFANVSEERIEVRFAGLISLWATARAALVIGNEAMEATRSGKNSLDTQPGSACSEAYELISAAISLIKNPDTAWPNGLPKPEPLASYGSLGWLVNNLFLGATSWILLHEIAHVHLEHDEVTTGDLLKRDENEADEWASRWVFKKAGSGLEREFRVFAVATGIIWLGLVDKTRRSSGTHPHASERFDRCRNHFGVDPISPGLELSAYITKAFFDPHAETPEVEDPEEAFNDALFGYSRLPR